MAGLDVGQVRTLVVRPTLEHLELYSLAAERLMLGTALAESGLRYLHQIHGPALGLWQMEPATHDDLWLWLRDRPERIRQLYDLSAPRQIALDMVWNLRYACAMARLLYYRHPKPLPDADDVAGLAAYWKLVYNTPQGKGDPQRWIEMYHLHGVHNV